MSSNLTNSLNSECVFLFAFFSFFFFYQNLKKSLPISTCSEDDHPIMSPFKTKVHYTSTKKFICDVL